MPKLSFVIPCYGSEHTIESVIAEIDETMLIRNWFDYEIICVNDGSPDNVLAVLRKLVEKHDKLTVVDLSKNMGKHSALMAAYAQVTGDYIVGLDDDGQCPLDRLWDLYDALGEKYDIALARYAQKKESWFRRIGSGFNRWTAKILIDKPKELMLSNFGITKRYIIDEIIKYTNPYPYIDGLLLRSTNRFINVDMEERERAYGSSHFTLVKSLKLWLNGFTAFSVKPLRIATVLGGLIALIGAFALIIVVVRKIINPDILMGYSSTMSVLLFIGGIIMIMLGLIGEYIGRIYICINNSPQYVIREIIQKSKEEEFV